MSRFFSPFFFPYALHSCLCVWCVCVRAVCCECMFSDACACLSFSLSVFPSIRWIVGRSACIWTITCFKLTHPHTQKNTLFFGYMKISVERDRFAACLFWPLKCKNIHNTRMKTRKTYNNANSSAWKWEFLSNPMSVQKEECFFSSSFWLYFSHFIQWWGRESTKRTLKFRLKTATCDFRRIVLKIKEKETNDIEMYILMIYFITVVKSISSQHPCNRVWFWTVDCIFLHSIRALAL